jgi:biopolymer transport protein ExbB
MDWMARGITFTLLAMGIASLAVFIERSLAFARSKRQSRSFAGEAAELIHRGDYSALRDRTAAYKGSHLARMLRPVLDTFLSSARTLRNDEAIVEVVRREMSRQQEQTGNDLRRGLSTLASVGSVAPFVGLLGTVVGIIAAFAKISSTGSGGLSSVAGGISEALVVTALGLVIAIPAVLLFNRLSGIADAIHQGLTTSSGQLLDHIEFFASAKRSANDRQSHAA